MTLFLCEHVRWWYRYDLWPSSSILFSWIAASEQKARTQHRPKIKSKSQLTRWPAYEKKNCIRFSEVMWVMKMKNERQFSLGDDLCNGIRHTGICVYHINLPAQQCSIWRTATTRTEYEENKRSRVMAFAVSGPIQTNTNTHMNARTTDMRRHEFRALVILFSVSPLELLWLECQKELNEQSRGEWEKCERRKKTLKYYRHCFDIGMTPHPLARVALFVFHLCFLLFASSIFWNRVSPSTSQTAKRTLDLHPKSIPTNIRKAKKQPTNTYSIYIHWKWRRR